MRAQLTASSAAHGAAPAHADVLCFGRLNTRQHIAPSTSRLTTSWIRDHQLPGENVEHLCSTSMLHRFGACVVMYYRPSWPLAMDIATHATAAAAAAAGGVVAEATVVVKTFVVVYVAIPNHSENSSAGLVRATPSTLAAAEACRSH